jgi:hypothetical protein
MRTAIGLLVGWLLAALLARLGGLDVHKRVKSQTAIPVAAMRAWTSCS